MNERTKPPTEGPDPRCSELQQLVLGLPRPDDALPDELEQHLAGCRACQVFRAQLSSLDALTRAQAPELPAAFELDLRRRLREVDSQSEARQQLDRATTTARRRPLRLVLAVAAMALLTVGVWAAIRWTSGSPAVQPTYHRLRLSIQSAQDYGEVLFDVQLPDGVRLLPTTGAVLGRGKSLAWRSPVRGGRNSFDLPLVARGATGTVRVRLQAGTRVWHGTVPLDARTQAASASAAPGRELRLAWVLPPRKPQGVAAGATP